MADINDNSEVDLAITRLQMAIAESDLRATNSKLAKLAKTTKSRTNYSSRTNQTKVFKPNGVSAPSNFKYEIMPSSKKPSFRAGERGNKVVNPRANEYRAGERGQGRTAPKVAAKPANKVWNPNTDSAAAKVIKKLGKSARKAYLGN